MTLQELLNYDNIVVQCHDDPDADAVASSWAVQQYLVKHGKRARLIYGGQNKIQKANMRLMLRLLRIKIEHIGQNETLSPVPDLLICVDCQYKGGKVQTFPARTVAVIDHHKKVLEGPLPELWEVRDHYGSCSTIVWDMLREAGVDVKQDKRLATALYYGLFMDTRRLEELVDGKDKEMRNDLESSCQENILRKLKTNNLSPEELAIVGRAFASARYDLKNRFALAEVEPCDPNVLGIISDQMLEVEDTDVCVVYTMLEDGAKISVRSCTLRTPAHELARVLAPRRGGGRNVREGGGTLGPDQYNPQGRDPAEDNKRVFLYLWEELQEYFGKQHNKLNVKAEVVRTPGKGKQAAVASITLEGGLTVHGTRLINSEKRYFVGMPQLEDGDDYRDICYPFTAEMRDAIDKAVLTEYRRLCGEEPDGAEAPEEAQPVRTEQPELNVKVFLPKKKPSKGFLAYARVTLGDCFVVNRVRVLEGRYGIFFKMPEQDGREMCAVTAELKSRLKEAIVTEYERLKAGQK